MKVYLHKCLLSGCTLIFFSCGVILMIIGFYLFDDITRVLISRLLGITNDKISVLPQPLFYYIAIGLTTAGLIAIITSLIGLWAICIHTYWILSLYFLIVLILLLIEFGVCLLMTVWPQCLGFNFEQTEMVKALQGNYGVPGKEQFTAAMDLIQTQFSCCAINSNINYDTSLWRLQSLGQRDWTVPLTCCYLTNSKEPEAYLDPKPVNMTLCQALQRTDYEKSRHLDGCLDKIEMWYREQYIIFLATGLVIAIVEFFVLLTIIFSCSKLSAKKITREITKLNDKLNENYYVNGNNIERVRETLRREVPGIPGASILVDGTGRTMEFYNDPNTFYKTKYQPTISRSYLV